MSLVDGFREVTLETNDRSALEASYTSALGRGDRSIYCEEPAGNVLELWDFFQRGEGADGVHALAASGG